MKKEFLKYLVVGLIPSNIFYTANADLIRLNEFVVDPQRDWNNSGSITPSDEWFELYNLGSSSVDLTNWRLELIDGTPSTQTLEGIIQGRGYTVINDPVGSQGISGRIELYDSSNNFIDGVSYGNWDDGDISNNAPIGNSLNGIVDESLFRTSYTRVDSVDWRLGEATYGISNGIPEPGTIGMGLIMLGVFGYVGLRKKVKELMEEIDLCK
jgi:hypothetical protein